MDVYERVWGWLDRYAPRISCDNPPSATHDHRAWSPIRRLLRRTSVVTWFSLAGLAMSAAAITLLVGIGEVQIQADRGGSGDLSRNPWFALGLFLGSFAVACAAVGIVANVFQVKARSEFPALRRLFLSMRRTQPTVYTRGGVSTLPTSFVRYELNLVNQEPSRTASLTAYLMWQEGEGPGSQSLRSRAEWLPSADGPEGAHMFLDGRQLPDPIVIPPLQGVTGFVFFEIWTLDGKPGAPVDIHFLDHGSGKFKGLDSL